MGTPFTQRFVVGADRGSDSALNQMCVVENYDLKQAYDQIFVSMYYEIKNNDVKAVIVSQKTNYHDGVHQYTLVASKVTDLLSKGSARLGVT